MLAVAFDFKVRAVEAGGDIAFYDFRCWIHYLTSQFITAFQHPHRQAASTRKNTAAIAQLHTGSTSDWPKKP